MVELESGVERIDLGTSGEGVTPSACIPPPADARLIQAIADGGNVRRIRLTIGEERMVVIDGQQSLIDGRARAEWSLGWLRRVDREAAPVRGEQRGRCQVAIDERGAVSVQRGNEVGRVLRQRLIPQRSRGGDQELMVQE